jgi:hypothetical protein
MSYVAVSNDGQMSAQEMLKELQGDKVCPIMAYEEDGIKIVPIFKSIKTAQKFAKRNTPREYIIGTMEIVEHDYDQIKAKGYETRLLEFPNKRKTHVIILDMTRAVETHNKGYRSTI